MIKTTEFKMDALRQAINIISINLDMHIFEIHRENKKDPLKFGVNWGAHGTSTPEEAMEYADRIKEAAYIAEMINRLELDHLTLDWEDPIEWSKYSEEEYKERFDTATGYILLMLENKLDRGLLDYFESEEV